MEDSLTDQPPSLLEAAKITAKAAGLEWAVAHRYYRDLQRDPEAAGETAWLPRSMGRNIWAASAPYIARLLIAIGAAASPDQACATVTAISEMTPDGRRRYETDYGVYHVERALADLLVDPDKLDQLDRIEFDPFDRTAEIVKKDGSVDRFATPGVAKVAARGFYWRGIIRAVVLADIAKQVRWRTYDEPPLNKTGVGEVDPDA